TVPTLATQTGAASEVVPPRSNPTPQPLVPSPVPPSPTNGPTITMPCPGCGLPLITPRPREISKPAVVIPQTAMYRDVYASIPFNRAEYNAYPSYRHDATMEFLFNQMRPTMIQRGTTNVYHYD